MIHPEEELTHSVQEDPTEAFNFEQDGMLDDCNVFVKYLPPELTDVEFYKLFKDYGNIISSKIMVDQGTGKSLGYGFVRFNNSASSLKAIRSMNGFRLSNKRLLCKLANTSPSSFATEYNKNPILNNQTPSDNLYIKPLLKDTSEGDLRALFSQFGPIVECKVMVDRTTGLSRQIGFVRYENPEHAKSAIEQMNNFKLFPNAQPLTVKYADTKEQKQVRKALRQKSSTPPTLDLPSPQLLPYYYYHQHPPYGPYGYPYPVPYPVPISDVYPTPSPSYTHPPPPSYPPYDYTQVPGNTAWMNYTDNRIYENELITNSETSSSVLSLPFYPEMVPYYPYDHTEGSRERIEQEEGYNSQPESNQE